MANFRLHYFSEVLRMNVGVNVIIPENTWGHSLSRQAEKATDIRCFGFSREAVLTIQIGKGIRL